MRTAYCEIERGRGCVSVRYFSERRYAAEQARRRAYAARRRRLAHIRETIGGVIGLLGFFLLMCVGGSEDLAVITVGGIAGLALMALGGWLGHAFYGQERDAEWLRRLREQERRDGR